VTQLIFKKERQKEVLLTHLRKSQSYANLKVTQISKLRKSQSYTLILYSYNSQTNDNITKVKTVFSTIRTKYITDKVLMVLTKGFRFYSHFKFVRKL